MLTPCRAFTLAIWTCLCPVWGENAQSLPFDQSETIYFKRGSIELDSLGKEKLALFVRRSGSPSEWVIGMPQTRGVTEQVALGRIRVVVGALLELGVVGVKTVYLPALPPGEFDPLILGVRGTSPLAAVDPNEDGAPIRPRTAPTVRPKVIPPVQPTPPVKPPTAPPVKKESPPPPKKREPVFSRSRWMRFSGGVEYLDNLVGKPPTAQLEVRPYPVLNLQADVATDVLMVTADVAKTAYSLFSEKEQADPTNQLDVSRHATSYYNRMMLAVNGLPSRLPVQVSYVDETSSSTAVLAKNTLLVDRNGAAWVTLMDGVNYAYRIRKQAFALDWCMGNLEKGRPLVALGVYFSHQERPFDVHEFGSSTNNFILTSTFNAYGLHLGFKGNPQQEGIHFGVLELKVGRTSRLTIRDVYHLVDPSVPMTAFNEVGLRFEPHYMKNLGARGFFKVTLPLDYSKVTFKAFHVQKANGDGSDSSLSGTSLGVGVKVDLGMRF